MFHARTARFDVTDTVALFGKTFRELNKGSGFMAISGFALTLTTRDVWLLGLVRHQ